MNRRGAWRLTGIILVVGGIWLGLLPMMARTSAVKERADWLEKHGINPAAFNYSDHRAGREAISVLNR